MKNFFYKLLNIQEPAPRVIELPPRRKVNEIADKESVLALRSHPGFQALLQKLAFARADLESQLRKTRFSSLSDLAYIQAGIYWANWLDALLLKETQILQQREPQALTADDLAMHERIKSAIHEIGT